MKSSEYAKNIGKTCSIPYPTFGDVTVKWTIKDVKFSYGVNRYLVIPVVGSGEMWVNADRVKIEE